MDYPGGSSCGSDCRAGRRRAKDHRAHQGHAKINKIAEHDHEQYLSILRLTVMSPEMPISERLIAGKKYIDAGGNGDVKHYYENLVREHTK